MNFLDNTLSLLKVCIEVYDKITTKTNEKDFTRPVQFISALSEIFKNEELKEEDQIFQKQNDELIQYRPEIISEDSTFIIIKKDCKLITLLDYYQ